MPDTRSSHFSMIGSSMNRPAMEGLRLNVPPYVRHAHLVEWVAQIASIAAFVVVAGGIAILVFRWLDKRRAQKNG
jgi:hypothetical protein